MYFFWRLYLSHLLADFPFQTDNVFRIKVHYRWGVLIHGGIAGILAFLFSIPYIKSYPIITVYLVLLWIFHTFIDKCKLLINPYIGKLNPLFFLLDQGLHLLSVYLVSLTVPSPLRLGLNIPFYNNTPFVIILSLYIIGTYGIYFFFHSFRTTQEFDATARKGMKYLEMIERLLVISFVGYSAKLIPVSILFIIPRAIICRRKGQKNCIMEIILGFILAVLIGIFIFNMREI